MPKATRKRCVYDTSIPCDGKQDCATCSKFDPEKAKKVKVINKKVISIIVRCIIAAIMLIVTFFVIERPLVEENFTWQWWLMLVLYIAALFVEAYDRFWAVIMDLVHKPHKFFTEDTLMALAAIGAFCIQEYTEGILVLLLAQIGEIFEEISVSRSKNIIIDTLDQRPSTAIRVLPDGSTEDIMSEQIQLGDILLVRAGDMIPVDGTIIDGDSFVDEAAITGEFQPRGVHNGDIVYSGSTNQEGVIKMEATSTYFDSTTSKILQLVLESGDKKSKATAFVDRFAKIYTPIVFLLAVILAVFPPLITCLVTAEWVASTWTSWIFVALTALVIACPCAIVISVPLTYFTGMTLASKGGVIIKGGNYLDRINDLGTVVFDKTGTLTTGKFNIVESNYIDIEEDKFKEYLYIGESLSSHPIGEAITEIYNLGISNESVTNYKEIGGKGLKFNYDDHTILVGNDALLDDNNVWHPEIDRKLTTINLAVDGVYHGYILMDDTPKETALRTINYLNDHNIKSIILSGAKKESAEYMGNLLGISEVYSDLLPDDKITHLENIIENSTKSVAYVGDGANDAPSIIMSDVGFAMGSIGSDVSVDNADVVIMNDEPIKVAEAMEISHITRRRATLIIAFTLTIKAIIFILDLTFAFFDTIALPMWVATIADSGLAIIMIIAAILLLRKKIKV